MCGLSGGGLLRQAGGSWELGSPQGHSSSTAPQSGLTWRVGLDPGSVWAAVQQASQPCDALPQAALLWSLEALKTGSSAASRTSTSTPPWGPVAAFNQVSPGQGTPHLWEVWAPDMLAAP